MAQDTALQVIELQQLPIIVERLHSVKADIERRTAEATSLICTEETYKSVKDARAQLTKEFKEYEAQRTAIKSKILEPYNAFEQVYRECVTAPFQQADAELKQKIADVTSGIVAQKTEALMDYYGELVEAADIDWLDNLTYRPKVNMSDSLTSLKKQAKAFVDGIVADVAAIEGMDNAAEIMVEYASMTLDAENAWDRMEKAASEGAENIIGSIQKILSAADAVSGININLSSSANIPHNADGTDDFEGGWTHINERGGEMAYLPSGTAIIPADKTDEIINNSTSSSSVTYHRFRSNKGNSLQPAAPGTCLCESGRAVYQRGLPP